MSAEQADGDRLTRRIRLRKGAPSATIPRIRPGRDAIGKKLDSTDAISLNIYSNLRKRWADQVSGPPFNFIGWKLKSYVSTILKLRSLIYWSV